MERMDIYANTIAFRIDKNNGDESEPEGLSPDHWPRRADTARRNLPPKIIYTLLGICILVSVPSLVLAIILMAQMGEMKRSDADFRMDLSQWKSNVTGNLEKAITQISKLQTEIPRQRESVHSCPEEWTKFKQSCYQFSSSSDTWVEAQRSCASANAHLAVINNAEEQGFLKTTMIRHSWIGLSDSASEGDWRWVDGTDYYSSVKFWADKQPNGHKDYDEDCAVVSKDGLWHDWPCSSKHPVICEKPAQ